MLQDLEYKRLTYSVVEAAQLLGVHHASVYRLIYAGKLKPITGFGRNRISADELERFVRGDSK